MRNGQIISSNSIFNVSVYFLRDTLLRVKGLALTASCGSGFLRNLFYLLTSVLVEVLLSRSREQGLKESTNFQVRYLIMAVSSGQVRARTRKWCTVCILCMHPVVTLHDSRA